jgi:hypothetical protein
MAVCGEVGNRTSVDKCCSASVRDKEALDSATLAFLIMSWTVCDSEWPSHTRANGERPSRKEMLEGTENLVRHLGGRQGQAASGQGHVRGGSPFFSKATQDCVGSTFGRRSKKALDFREVVIIGHVAQVVHDRSNGGSVLLREGLLGGVPLVGDGCRRRWCPGWHSQVGSRRRRRPRR